MQRVLICLWLGMSACNSDPDYPDHVGNACVPEAIPTSGFDGNEASVERASAQCDANPCVVYKLQGDPTNLCDDGGDPNCVSQAEVADRVYCSCRCAGAPVGETNCECPDAFSCQPIVDVGDPSVDGSYCVRKGTF